MTGQRLDATWAPVPCCLADLPDFLQYISLADYTAALWFKLFVFSELRLNNKGLLAAREIRKLFCKPLNPLPRLPSD